MRVSMCLLGIWMCTAVLAVEPTSPEWFGRGQDTVIVRAFFDNQEMLQN
ncbi:MAG: hypothetical protein HKN70_12800, partial [Gammaproteobacteria bacterium]|nr:hypothetical protein [Gammaproteobacteria bacterium]